MKYYFYLEPDWQPPHCPNPNCPSHNDYRQPWRRKRIGSYRRQAPPYRIPRWICLRCRRSFSGQTFHFTYWQKRPLLGPAILSKIANSMANRQIARDLEISPTTVARQLQRLGRHCLLFHHRLWQTTRLQGPLAIDGFESFEFSQYFPFHHHLAVECDASFIVHFTDSPLRRKGRMTRFQKKRRQRLETRLGKPDPQAVRKDVSELLRVSLRDVEQATVRSDDHHSYPRAIREQTCVIHHEVTSGKKFRGRGNALFEINAADGFIRHSQAGHRRQTWAPPKRRQGSAERLASYWCTGTMSCGAGRTAAGRLRPWCAGSWTGGWA